MAKKLTPNQLMYQREIQRLSRGITSLKGKGYKFEENPLPSMPSRVTKKDIEELAKLTAKDYSLGRISAEQLPVRTATAKDYNTFTTFDRQAIANYLSQFERFKSANSNYNLYDKVQGWINKLVDDNGIEEVAEMIMRASENGVEFTYLMSLDESKLYQYMQEMLGFLQNQGDIYKDDLMEFYDAFETYNSWDDIE